MLTYLATSTPPACVSCSGGGGVSVVLGCFYGTDVILLPVNTTFNEKKLFYSPFFFHIH